MSDDRNDQGPATDSQESAQAHPEPVTVASFGTTGEAEVAQAKLLSFGIESELSDQVEGGTVPVDGEAGVGVVVRAIDEVEARRVLSRDV